ncbi:MAG: DUF3301 domain-containing protein [Proteobacteria bacterium]|nr:DUF3301 domain-containing protein [Pseudomonadota bacterium]
MYEIPLLLITGFIILFIGINSKARDIARAYGKRETQRRQFLFLDDSISMKSMKITTKGGKIGILRSYAFEFNNADFQRYEGKIELFGYNVLDIQYFHPDHIE